MVEKISPQETQPFFAVLEYVPPFWEFGKQEDPG